MSKCTVCAHTQRNEIDIKLIESVPLRTISTKYGVTPAALFRHGKNHLPAQLLKASEIKETVAADSLVARLKELNDNAEKIFKKAEKADNYSAAVSALKEQRGILELYAKLAGELSTVKTTTNIFIMPEWISLRTAIIQAVAPYPEALQAINKAIGET